MNDTFNNFVTRKQKDAVTLRDISDLREDYYPLKLWKSKGPNSLRTFKTSSRLVQRSQ